MEKLGEKSNSNKELNEIKEKFSICIRQEVFDHLVYPFSFKIDDNQLVSLFRQLHFMSSLDYKITLDHWLDQSLTFIQGMTDKDAKVLFYTYKIFISDFETKKDNKNNKNQNQSEVVDVRYFALFIALQSFSCSKNKIMDTMDKFNDLNNYNTSSYTNYSSSPINSPRKSQNSLRGSITNQLNDISQMISYIRNNIKLFLRLIATYIHNSEIQLNSSEFDTLKFFFRDPLSNSNLSQLAPFFKNFSSTTKVNIEKITDWILSLITNNSFDVDEQTIYIKGLSKATTVKFDCLDKNVKIQYCEDSQIFIDSSVTNLKISQCINCTIFCASVKKITTFEKCENVNLTVCTNFIRIGNNRDCKSSFYSMFQPILYGNNMSLILGPHNVYYDDLHISLKNFYLPFVDLEEGIRKKSNEIMYEKYKDPIIIQQPLTTSITNTKIKNCYELLDPKDFSPLSTPFSFTKNIESSFFLTPQNYLDEYLIKINVFKNVQKMIKDADLDSTQQKILHAAIQGHFREWLISTGNIKSITDILKVMDLSQC